MFCGYLIIHFVFKKDNKNNVVKEVLYLSLFASSFINIFYSFSIYINNYSFLLTSIIILTTLMFFMFRKKDDNYKFILLLVYFCIIGVSIGYLSYILIAIAIFYFISSNISYFENNDLLNSSSLSNKHEDIDE